MYSLSGRYPSVVVYWSAAQASSSRTAFVARAIPSVSIREDEGRPPANEMMDGSSDTRNSSSRKDSGTRDSLVANLYCRILALLIFRIERIGINTRRVFISRFL
jgi:hypothetical protein